MANVYSLDGLLVFGLLFVCTCAYFRKVPRLKVWLLSEKRGVWGVFYKEAWPLDNYLEENLALQEIDILFSVCGDWNQTSCSSGNILHCHGFLRALHKMNSSASDGQCCWNEDAKEGTSLLLQWTIFLRGIDIHPAQMSRRNYSVIKSCLRPREWLL
ncbi:hypothetical protein lerEdw1_018659 [Lerista edwardsae]|nr:hypothetical protein lerEdw1_018659 [Lerista edwardsae]